MSDPPHDATKTSDKLISVRLGGFATGGDLAFGLFDIHIQNDTFNSVTDPHFRGISVNVNQPYGNCLYCYQPFSCYISDCQFVGGWNAIHIEGGYDYRVRNHFRAQGTAAAIFALTCLIDIDEMQRCDVGDRLVLLHDSKFYLNVCKTGNMNAMGRTTESLFRNLPGGAYASTYYVGLIETDNENNVAPTSGLIHAARQGVLGTWWDVGKVTTGQNGSAVVVLDGGDDPVTESEGPGYFRLHEIMNSDGFIISSSGPGWYVKCDNSANFTFADVEVVRYTNPTKTGNVRYYMQGTYPPLAGRFAPGVVYEVLGMPVPSGVDQYICTGYGTAAWNPAYLYQPTVYCSDQGVEYQLTRGQPAAIGDRPPNPTGMAVTLHESPSTTLNVAIAAGTFTQAAGTTFSYAGTASRALVANANNFLYLTDAGVLTVNQSGFPTVAPICQLAVASTDGTTVTAITQARNGNPTGLAVTLHETPSSTLSVAIASGSFARQTGSIFSYAGNASFVLAANTTTWLWLTEPGVLTTGTNGWPGGFFVPLAIVTTNNWYVTKVQNVTPGSWTAIGSGTPPTWKPLTTVGP
jgi:hypothetical protein